MEEPSIQHQIEALERQLSGDLFADMDIRQQIHALRMQLSGTELVNLTFECVEEGS